MGFGLSQSYVGQFVGQCEDLRSLRVGFVDEHQRGKLIDQSEAAELIWTQLTMRVRPSDAADDDQDARLFGVLTKSNEGCRQGGEHHAPRKVEPQRTT